MILFFLIMLTPLNSVLRDNLESESFSYWDHKEVTLPGVTHKALGFPE